MSHVLKEEQLSDDEVYIGKLSLKEIKKHILWNNHHQHTKYTCATSKEDYENDIKIIETHSAPDLNHKEVPASDNKVVLSTSLSPPGPEVYANWEVKPVDDSFLKVEQMVSDFCMSPKKIVKKDELNNTLDIIDYILNNGAPNTTETVSHENQRIDELKTSEIDEISKNELNIPGIEPGKTKTPSKTCNQLVSEVTESILLPSSPAYFTPAKHEIKSEKTEKFQTPSTNLKVKTPIFKTPSNTLSIKKPSATSLKRTPIKSNAYQHIASPVASYIKNCPIAPLVKEVRPTKPLPGTSSIPKFVKTPALNKPSNKENVNLPSVAYKSAKKTQVIDVPDEEKLPQTQIMKKITSALPKPLIMKHNHREINLAKRALGSRQEDSFADLSLRQADVSVCTQKSAFNKPKRLL